MMMMVNKLDTLADRAAFAFAAIAPSSVLGTRGTCLLSVVRALGSLYLYICGTWHNMAHHTAWCFLCALLCLQLLIMRALRWWLSPSASPRLELGLVHADGSLLRRYVGLLWRVLAVGLCFRDRCDKWQLDCSNSERFLASCARIVPALLLSPVKVNAAQSPIADQSCRTCGDSLYSCVSMCLSSAISASKSSVR